MKDLQANHNVALGFLPNSWSTATTTQSAAFNNATAFYNAYAQNLDKVLGPAKSLQVAAKMKDLEDANRQADELNKLAYSHISQNAAVLDKETIGNWTSKLGGPPPNPVDLMPGRPRTASGTGEGIPAGGLADAPPGAITESAPPPPPPPAASAPPTTGPSPSIGDAYENSGLIGIAKQAIPGALTAASGAMASSSLAGPIASLPGIFANKEWGQNAGEGADSLPTVARGILTGAGSGPISPATVQANRVAVNKRILASTSPQDLMDLQKLLRT